MVIRLRYVVLFCMACLLYLAVSQPLRQKGRCGAASCRSNRLVRGAK